MKKQIVSIIITLLFLVMGFSTGSFSASIKAKNELPQHIATAIETEMRIQEEAAQRVYLDGKRDTAAWALEELLKSYSRNAEIICHTTQEQNRRFGLPVTIAHLKLFRTYSSMNDDSKAQAHLAEALRLNPGTTTDELLAMIANTNG